MTFRVALLVDVILSLQSNSLHDHVALPQPCTFLNKWISVHEQKHHFPLRHKIIIKSKSTNWSTGSGTYNPNFWETTLIFMSKWLTLKLKRLQVQEYSFIDTINSILNHFRDLTVCQRGVFSVWKSRSHSSHVIPHTQTRVNEALRSDSVNPLHPSPCLRHSPLIVCWVSRQPSQPNRLLQDEMRW
jgi:hypothetical protein